MKTRFRSILCALLALCTLISLPIAAEAKTSLYSKWQDEVPGTYGTHYDAEKAIQHAKENWNDGIGVCDQFVKSCLRAGGIIIAAGDVDPVKDALIAIGLGAEQKLVISDNGGRVYAEDNPGVQAGDMLNFYCHDCGESVHTVLIGGTIEDSRGNYFYTYGHNPGWNEEIDWIGNFTHTADNGEKHSDFTLNVVKISREKLACRHSFVYQENKLNLYDEKHPHKMYVKCEKGCGTKYYLGWNAYVSTCTTCNPPLGDKPVVTVTPEETRIFVEWSTVEGATSYQVERATKKDGPWYKMGDPIMSTTLYNSSVEIGITYYYRVTANLKSGKKAVSDVVSCRISDGRPAAPVITGTFNKDKHAVISWEAVENAVEYKVYRATSPNDNYSYVGKTTSTSYTDDTVTTAMTYYYKVTAVDANGTASEHSDYVCVSYDSEKPLVTASIVDGKIVLNWSSVKNVLCYQVERAKKQGGTYFNISGDITLPKFTNANVEPGITYYYRVIAVLEKDGSGNVTKSVTSDVVTCEIPDGKPDIPVISGAFNKDNHAVISWKATENAATYEIFRGDSPSSTFTSIGTTSSTSYTDKKVIVGRTYYYKVTAISADGKASDYSNYVAVAYKSDKPIVTASVEDKAIALYWTIVDGAQGYQVSRAKSENGTYFKLSEVAMPKFTNSSVDPGVVYYYKVTAILEKDEAGNITKSSVSDIVSCMIPVGKPAAPKISAKTDVASGKPVISWSAVLGAKEYTVYRATSSKGTYSKVGTVSGTSFEDTSAAVGKKYYYRVKAVGADGTASDNSSYKSAACKCATPVVAAANTVSSGKVKLTWGKVSGATKYEVYRSTKKTYGFKKITSTAKAYYTDSGASVGTTYYYKVKVIASSSTYNSEYSAALKAKRICAQPDLSVKRNTSTGQPNLSWDKVSGAKEYKIYRAEGSVDGKYTLIKTATSKTTSYADTKALPGVTYFYRVDVIGSKSGTNSVAEEPISCLATCAKPSISVKNDAATGDPVITWKAVKYAVSYRVQRSTKSSSGFQDLDIAFETSFQDTTAATGKKYYYRVIAVTEGGESGSASSAKSVYSKVGAPVIEVALSGKKPKVTWEKVEGATKYEVYRATSKSGKYTKVKTATGASYTDKSAKKGKTYYYKVKAVASSSSYNSAYSNIFKIKSK